jgi:hypothetical protein
MAKRIFTFSQATWTQSNRGSVTLTGCFMAVSGAATTQVVDILEILISGMSTASTVAGFTLGYASTLESAVGGSALAAPAADGPEMVNATALATLVKTFTAASTTMPTPSNATTLPVLNVGLNTFGGIIRWNAAPTQQWTQVGNAVNGGESILWNDGSYQSAGACAANAHIIYEPY